MEVKLETRYTCVMIKSELLHVPLTALATALWILGEPNHDYGIICTLSAVVDATSRFCESLQMGRSVSTVPPAPKFPFGYKCCGGT